MWTSRTFREFSHCRSCPPDDTLTKAKIVSLLLYKVFCTLTWKAAGFLEGQLVHPQLMVLLWNTAAGQLSSVWEGEFEKENKFIRSSCSEVLQGCARMEEFMKHRLRIFCLRGPLADRSLRDQSCLYHSRDWPMFCLLTVVVLMLPGRSVIPHRATRHFKDKWNVINRLWLIIKS